MKHFSNKGYEVLLVTDARGNNFIKNYSEFKSYILNAGTPTNKNLLKKIFSFSVIFFSIIRSIFILKKEKPDLIFGFGAMCLFQFLFHQNFFNLPLIIYENNIALGRANKYLSRFSNKILVAKKIKENFCKKDKIKTYQVGSILDKDIINCPVYEKINNKEIFSILVLGGSQGQKYSVISFLR